ncbi:uncharacterized protein LOC135936499 [Cloeon dipterum]|uniref:uncharacterized protein LOC135936499 n=1 Tax=Cloeon dipterum TaxID=197152 RepID=UPI00322095FC
MMAPKKCAGRQSRKKSRRKFSVKHQAAAERAVSYMIHTDNLTFNTVEKKGFKRLAQTLSQGQFECKSRRTFGRLREKTVQDVKRAFAEKLRNSGHFSLTTDACTLTKPKKSYLVVTGHILDEKNACLVGMEFPPILANKSHTSESICQLVNMLLEEFKIRKEKISAITTDSAANMILAASLLKLDHVPCLNHKLHLAVMKSIEDCDSLKPTVQLLKSLSAFFNRSPAASNMLIEVQKENGVEERSQLLLVISCETRWNNICDMVERYLILNQHVTEVMERLGNPHELPDEEKLVDLDDCFTFLKPCKEVTVLLSGSSYPTSSITIPTCRNLQHALTTMIPSTLTGGQFKQHLLRNLNLILKKSTPIKY